MAAIRQEEQPLVLLLADNEDDRDLYVLGLQGGRFTVQCFELPCDTGALAARLAPSAVVLSVDWPERGGWQTCAQLSALPATSDIPIVMLPAAVRPDFANRKAARRHRNCAAFVAKPCDPGGLAVVIERVLAGERNIEEVRGLHPTGLLDRRRAP